MADAGFDDEIVAQVFVDGFRLGGRFHDDQSLTHVRESSLVKSGRGRMAPVMSFLLRAYLPDSGNARRGGSVGRVLGRQHPPRAELREQAVEGPGQASHVV